MVSVLALDCVDPSSNKNFAAKMLIEMEVSRNEKRQV